MNVLIIGGGISNEREVSLRSARAVYDAVPRHYSKQFYDWDGSEEWLKTHAGEYEAILPILHGEGGEDGTIQALLESLNVQYLGSTSKVSKICIDKQKTQALLQKNNILVPAQKIYTFEEYVKSKEKLSPHVVKPINGGSSLDAFIITKTTSRPPSLESSFEKYHKMVVEEYIDGVEITVPVLQGKELPVIKIIPPQDAVFDYENKYNGKTQEICAPSDIDQALQEQALHIAKKCHEILSCRHLSRVDMIITAQNDIYTLEVNTIPGLTHQSLFPKAAQYIGLSMQDLVDYLIQMVVNQSETSQDNLVK